MRYFLLIGGFAGFALVFVSGFYAGNRPASALLDAAVGCVVGAMLFRVLHAAFVSGLKERLLEKNKHGVSLVRDDADGSSKVS